MTAKKEAYYFSHDSNARNDVKMVRLRRRHNAAGYGVYWMIIECLREQAEHELPVDAIPDLAYEFQVAEEIVESVVNDFDLFTIEGGRFFSIRLKRSMDEYNSRKLKLSEAGKRGNSKRWGNIDPSLSPPDPNPIGTRSQPNRIKGKESKGKKSKGDSSIPPTLSSVQEYFEKNGYSTSAGKKAFDFYDTAGWKDSNGKAVVNWKQKMLGVWFTDDNKIKATTSKFVP